MHQGYASQIQSTEEVSENCTSSISLVLLDVSLFLCARARTPFEYYKGKEKIR